MKATITPGDPQPGQSATRSMLRVLLVTAAILLVPLVAMQFTGEVNWSAGDFLVAAVLLGSTGLLCEWGTKKFRTRKSRCIALAAIGCAFLFVWAELAVGIVGSPLAGS
ncbi:hypothetical protein [Massilia sp. GCM10023247]|uniref:hypothetical protein n=1 Tax=Massilia sp. GCM10023247 TaxID=3252643 RepID=UPI003624399E